jgi:hypothetical protein
LTTIFDLSKNDILCDLIMMHKCRVFLTVVEKIMKEMLKRLDIERVRLVMVPMMARSLGKHIKDFVCHMVHF